MQRRAVTRWLSTVVAIGASALGLAACGGSGSGTGASSRDASVDDASFSFNDGGGSSCKPKSCQDQGYTCGKNSDTCGNLIDCGSCVGPEYCGGGGYSKCGGNVGQAADGAALCTPKTCADFPAGTCGPQSDGCGGLTPACAVSDAALCPSG